MTANHTTSTLWTRLAALSLVIAGVCCLLYPAIRPFSDEATLRGAEAFASSAWLLAHSLVMVGCWLLAWSMVNRREAVQWQRRSMQM